MQLFGSKFEEVAQNQIRINENRSQVASLLLSLPEQFTRNELMALRVRNGQSSRVDMVLNRWRNAGFITQVAKNTYHKTPKACVR
jgi:Fe2+ or Zn2+ uptake regulation protein